MVASGIAQQPDILMTAERWQRIKEVFADALELDPSAREAFVREQSGDDSELLDEVIRMLREMPRQLFWPVGSVSCASSHAAAWARSTRPKMSIWVNAWP